jgi:hypothetical protein
MTSTQFVAILTALINLQSAGTSAGYSVNPSILNYNDDTGALNALIVFQASKTGAFVVNDISTYLSWITSNIVAIMPQNSTITKAYAWNPAP